MLLNNSPLLLHNDTLLYHFNIVANNSRLPFLCSSTARDKAEKKSKEIIEPHSFFDHPWFQLRKTRDKIKLKLKTGNVYYDSGEFILMILTQFYVGNNFCVGRVDRIDVFSIFTEMGVYGNISTDLYVRGNISIDLLYFPLVSSFFSFNNL